MLDTGYGTTAELTEAISGLTADEAVRLTRELCARLTESGVSFHGNIWPGSVRIENGKAVLGEGSDAPVSGRTAGQVEYLSPEYFWENDGTGASDVYSLGLLLYSACNGGYLPFQPKGGALTDKDRSGALRKRMKGEDISAPAGVSNTLGEVLIKALAYEPEDRYADPAALMEALGDTIEALPSGYDPAISEPELPAQAPAETPAAEPAAAAAVTAAAGAAAANAAQSKSGRKGKKGRNAKKSAPAPEAAPAVKAEPVIETGPAAKEEPVTKAETAVTDEPAAEKKAEAAPAAKTYTVQKDFEKTRGSKKSAAKTAAPASRTKTKKKKTSPVIPILCVAAVAVIGGGIWYALNHQAPTPSTTLDTETLTIDEPVVVLPVESPEATEAPAPTEGDVHTGAITDLVEGEQAEDAQAEGEEGEPAVGSTTIDGMDVTPESGTIYVTGSGVNLRTGPGTSYQVANTLSRGTKLTLTGTVNGWSQVQYEGEEYYVSSALVSAENPLGEDEQAESTAAPADTTAPASTPAPSSGTKTTTAVGEVTVGSGTLRVTSDVNIRSGPGANYDKIGEAKAGETLTATGTAENGTWYRITYDGKEGYVNRKLVSASGFSTMTEKSGTLEVVSDANIRSGPGTSYDKLGEVKEGETLTMTGLTGSNWYQVSFEGKTGYVAGNLVKEA